MRFTIGYPVPEPAPISSELLEFTITSLFYVDSGYAAGGCCPRAAGQLLRACMCILGLSSCSCDTNKVFM